MWTVSLHCERPPEMTCLRAPRTAKYAREEFRRARAVPGDLGEARGIASAPRPREGDSPRREEPSEAIPGDAVLQTDNKQQAPVPGGSTRPRSKVGRHCHSPLPSLRPAEVRSFFFEYYDAARPRPFARRRADQPPPEQEGASCSHY